jgi:hypothetical protein
MSNKKRPMLSVHLTVYFLFFMVFAFGIYAHVFCPWSHGTLDSNIAFDLQRSNYQTV